MKKSHTHKCSILHFVAIINYIKEMLLKKFNFECAQTSCRFESKQYYLNVRKRVASRHGGVTVRDTGNDGLGATVANLCVHMPWRGWVGPGAVLPRSAANSCTKVTRTAMTSGRLRAEQIGRQRRSLQNVRLIRARFHVRSGSYRRPGNLHVSVP